MSMNVEITFKGDVIISEQPYGWEVVAVTDKCHVAKLTSNLDPRLDKEMRNPGKQRNVRFEQPTAQPNKTEAGDLWDTLLNLSSKEMHGVNSSTGKTNLVGAWMPDGVNEIVRFIIPYGSASVPTTVSAYWIEKYGDPTSWFVRDIPTATSVMFSFVIDGGKGLKRIVDDNSVLTTDEFTYKDDSPLEITIDNDCHGGSGSKDDFLRYYAYLREHEPVGGRQTQFICGKHDAVYLASAEYAAQKAAGHHVFSSILGNCDPVGSDPPLWP